MSWQTAYYIYAGMVGQLLILWGIFFSDRPSLDACIAPLHESEYHKIIKNRDPNPGKVEHHVDPDSNGSVTITSPEAPAKKAPNDDVFLEKVATVEIDIDKKVSPTMSNGAADVRTIPWGAILTTPAFLGTMFALFAGTNHHCFLAF